MKNSTASSQNTQNSNTSNFVDKENYDKLINKAQDIGHTLKENSESAVETSIGFAKKYPVHTAIGAGVVGLAIGLLTGRMRR